MGGLFKLKLSAVQKTVKLLWMAYLSWPKLLWVAYLSCLFKFSRFKFCMYVRRLSGEFSRAIGKDAN